jgi:Protein of unknown function (DUF2934)
MAAHEGHWREWVQLIRGEYEELPGLQLTGIQVQELWGFEPTVAEALLGALVSSGILLKTYDGVYLCARRPRSPRTPERRQGGMATTRKRPAIIAREEQSGHKRPRVTAAPSEEEVRIRAYYHFLQRGGSPGDPLADWLRAERELGAGLRGSSPGPTGDSLQG